MSLFQYVVDLLESTLAKYQQVCFLEVQNNLITERTRKMTVYTTVDAFQSFVITYGWYHLNESIPFITKTYDKIRGKAILKFAIKMWLFEKYNDVKQRVRLCYRYKLKTVIIPHFSRYHFHPCAKPASYRHLFTDEGSVFITPTWYGSWV